MKKYEEINAFILATIDKKKILVKSIFKVNPKLAVPILREKRDLHIRKSTTQLRRLQESLNMNDLKKINAKKLF